MKRFLWLLLLPSVAFGQSAAQRLSQLGHVLNAGSPAATSAAATIPMLQSGSVVVLSWPALINGDCLTNNGSTLSWVACGAGSGTVTSVGMTVPSWLTVAGSPVTTSGTLAVTATGSQTANQFLATPNGVAGAVGLRAITAADIPVLTATQMPAFSGDCTSSSGSTVTTCSKVNGASFPTSATVIGSNSSAQPVAATTTGTGSVVLASAPTIANLTVTGTCTGCGSGSVTDGAGTTTAGELLQSTTTAHTYSLITLGQGLAINSNVLGTTAPTRTVTTSPTVASTDMGGAIFMNVTGGGTLTIPAISSSVFPSGATLDVTNYSASTATVTTTPTINSGGGCASGTGIPSGDSWQLVSNGTSLDCIQTISASSGGAASNLQTFTANGTWTKPTGSYSDVKVVCIAGGSGGGSGAVEPSGTVATGGGAGGGNPLMQEIFPYSAMPSTVTVTIGAAGTGGAAVTATGAGNNGTQGGNTTFGSLLTAYPGGPGGGGGNAAASTGGGSGGLAGAAASSGIGGGPGCNVNGGSGNPGNSTGCDGGGASGAGDAATGVSGSNGGNSALGSSGGGAGGGMTATPAASSGGKGGSINGFAATSTAVSCTAGPAGAASTGEAGGQAGGGGGSCITGNGGTGGNGGGYGAPGGGGGAAENGVGSSGAGGNGTGGACWVTTW